MRERWFGATGRRVPAIAVEGEDLEVLDEGRVRIGDAELAALVVEEAIDPAALRDAHLAGTPVVVRAEDADAVARALEHPEVACVVVAPTRRELRELDLTRLKYG